MQTAATLLAIMPFPDIDPVAIRIGPLAVHWYGLAYVAGILLGWMYARGLVRKVALWRHDTPPLGIVKLDDFLVWAAIGIVVGGRLGYVLFYDLASVLASPVRIFEIWNGGMSFHGGLIGTTLAMILFARRNGVPIWSMFDIVACAAPIGIFFGRLANFINGELWGRLTDVPWAVVFPNGGPFARHPSQLYEAAMEGLLLFLALFALAYGAGKLKQPGFIAGAFVSLYAIARIVNEFFREPDVQLGYLAGGWLTMGMLLSLPMFALGLWAMMRATRAAVRAVN